ncbi:hypothetical protein SJR91_00040 [Aeromonas caviae]|uniref:hypothetical protein n=1 Tax=Aeromonas caviae TaxID=648 RepID=UPI0029D95E1A|nr:hypothetical protein [Aeromonas caviae]MDX7845992.1 hypothetical protein [Aeromonas caviae]
MPQLKTLRNQQAEKCKIGLNHKLFSAASDYFCSLNHPEWNALYNATHDEYHHDLMLILKRWCDHEENKMLARFDRRVVSGGPL